MKRDIQAVTLSRWQVFFDVVWPIGILAVGAVGCWTLLMRIRNREAK